jgi:hypothetical protein
MTNTHVTLALGSKVPVMSPGRFSYSGSPRALIDDPEILHKASSASHVFTGHIHGHNCSNSYLLSSQRGIGSTLWMLRRPNT